MDRKRIEEYAVTHGLSNNQAKRALKSAKDKSQPDIVVQRGSPVKGTGRPKGAKK